MTATPAKPQISFPTALEHRNYVLDYSPWGMLDIIQYIMQVYSTAATLEDANTTMKASFGLEILNTKLDKLD